MSWSWNSSFKIWFLWYLYPAIYTKSWGPVKKERFTVKLVFQLKLTDHIRHVNIPLFIHILWQLPWWCIREIPWWWTIGCLVHWAAVRLTTGRVSSPCVTLVICRKTLEYITGYPLVFEAWLSPRLACLRMRSHWLDRRFTAGPPVWWPLIGCWFYKAILYSGLWFIWESRIIVHFTYSTYLHIKQNLKAARPFNL